MAVIELKKTIKNMAREEEIIPDKKEKKKIKLAISKTVKFTFS